MYDVNDADAGAYSDCGADGAAADAHDGPISIAARRGDT